MASEGAVEVAENVSGAPPGDALKTAPSFTSADSPSAASSRGATGLAVGGAATVTAKDCAAARPSGSVAVTVIVASPSDRAAIVSKVPSKATDATDAADEIVE